MYLNCTEVYIAITVQNAGSHKILITSKIQKEFLTVNVAALSSLMLYCMEKI